MDNLIRPVVLILCFSFVLSCRRRSCSEEADNANQQGKPIPGSSNLYSARASVSNKFGEYVQIMNQLGLSPTTPTGKVFRTLDTDDDKQVTLTEWVARGGEIRSFASLLVRYDNDSDGQISKKESRRASTPRTRTSKRQATGEN